QITATVNAAGPYANTAQVSASDVGDPDSTPGNDVAGEDDQDTVTPVPVPVADLTIVKTQREGASGVFQSTPLTVRLGDVVQFNLMVTNTGPSPVSNATIADAVPANFT